MLNSWMVRVGTLAMITHGTSMKLIRSSLVAALIVGIGAASAGANTITPTFIGVTDLGNGTFLWEYQATLENGRLKANANTNSEEFFTFYDIAGYVPGSA